MAAVRNADTLERLVELLESNAGDVARACSAIECSTGWLKRWMRDDPKVDATIRDAMDTGTAVLESAMIKRAVDGYEKPIYFKEELVGHETKYSDQLLMFALSARKKDVYGKTIDINQNVNVKHLSDDELTAKIDMLASRLGMALPAPDAIISDAEFTPVIELDDLL